MFVRRKSNFPLALSFVGIVIILAVLAFYSTNASVTFDSKSITSDTKLDLTGVGSSTIDVGSSTLSLQTTNNGPITIGTGLVTFGGPLTVSGNATTTKLAITNLGSSGRPCLSIGTNGAVATTTCGAVVSSYSTVSSAVSSTISATTMISSTSAQHDYLFAWTISLSATGSGCTGNTTVVLNAIFTDPSASGSTTEALGTITIASSGNGTVGFIAEGTDNILAKTGTAVQYSTSNYTAGAGCTTNPAYQVSPTLIQLW